MSPAHIDEFAGVTCMTYHAYVYDDCAFIAHVRAISGGENALLVDVACVSCTHGRLICIKMPD